MTHSHIHAPLPGDVYDPPSVPPRISRLANLDSYPISGTPRSLGPGGASAVYTNAIQKALIDEMADQLRFGVDLEKREGCDIACWAAAIIAAFRE